MLENPRVVGLYVTNAAAIHPRIHMFPIGVHSPSQWSACLQRNDVRIETKTTLLMCDCLSTTSARAGSRLLPSKAMGSTVQPAVTWTRKNTVLRCSKRFWPRRGNGRHNHREIELGLRARSDPRPRPI